MTIYFLIVESLDCKDKKKGESLKSKGKNFSRTETRSCTEPANSQLSIFNFQLKKRAAVNSQQLSIVFCNLLLVYNRNTLCHLAFS